MTVRAAKPALNIRAALAAARATANYHEEQFWFVGDGSETDFVLVNGWVPLHVFDAGALQKEGSGDSYTVTFDGFTTTVVFAVAPGNLNDVCVIGVKA